MHMVHVTGVLVARDNVSLGVCVASSRVDGSVYDWQM